VSSQTRPRTHPGTHPYTQPVPMFDLSLTALENYRPTLDVPPDLAEFWRRSCEEAAALDLDLSVRPVENKLAVIDSFDVRFAGWGGQQVQAWLHVPAHRTGVTLPTVVHYLGYSRGRGFPHEQTLWAQAGYAHLVLDTRGQGWGTGGMSGTADLAAEAGMLHTPGLLTAGLQDPESYYYRRVYCDALRLLAVAEALEQTDSEQLIITGMSQGGGITLAVAGLAGLLGLPLIAAAPDVAFLCHFRRAVEITGAEPYAELTRYLAAWRDHSEQAYRTLSYFDGAILGRWARVPALFSVALMDEVCPPSTVFAAYHHYGTEPGGTDSSAEPPKSMRVFPHNGHEGGGAYHVETQLDWFAERFASRGSSSQAR
jgi:cephalosporin-C deacetylase